MKAAQVSLCRHALSVPRALSAHVRCAEWSGVESE
jgi:hypothetical protein